MNFLKKTKIVKQFFIIFLTCTLLGSIVKSDITFRFSDGDRQVSDEFAALSVVYQNFSEDVEDSTEIPIPATSGITAEMFDLCLPHLQQVLKIRQIQEGIIEGDIAQERGVLMKQIMQSHDVIQKYQIFEIADFLNIQELYDILDNPGAAYIKKVSSLHSRTVSPQKSKLIEIEIGFDQEISEQMCVDFIKFLNQLCCKYNMDGSSEGGRRGFCRTGRIIIYKTFLHHVAFQELLNKVNQHFFRDIYNKSYNRNRAYIERIGRTSGDSVDILIFFNQKITEQMYYDFRKFLDELCNKSHRAASTGRGRGTWYGDSQQIVYRSMNPELFQELLDQANQHFFEN